MIYNIDTIPAKLFFKINEKGDLSLLSDEKLSNEQLQNIWEEILSSYQEITNKKANDIQLLLSKKIQSLSSKLFSIKNAVFLLRSERDSELEYYLKNKGYKLEEETFLKDLQRIEELSQTIEIKIKKLLGQLDSDKSKVKSNLTFEEILLGYMTILGFGYKDANTITLLEYIAIEKQVNIKLKAMKNGKG